MNTTPADRRPEVEPRLRAWGKELRRVLELLRESLAIAVEAVENDEAPQPSRELLLYCRGFCAALGGHHRSEDRALFPKIVAARPDLAPTIAQLSQDHSMMDHLIGALEQDLEGATKEERLRHLDGIGAVMETHFRYEERRLIEVLDSAGDLDGASSAELYGPLA